MAVVVRHARPAEVAALAGLGPGPQPGAPVGLEGRAARHASRTAHSATLISSCSRRSGTGWSCRRSSSIERPACGRKNLRPQPGQARRRRRAPPSSVPPQFAQGVAVGEQRPVDVGDHERDAVDGGGNECLGWPDREAVPAGRAVQERQRCARDRRRLLLLDDALDVHAVEVGRRLLERLAHRQLRASTTTHGTTCSCPRAAAGRSRPRSRAARRCRRATPCTDARCRAPADRSSIGTG